MFQMGRKHVTCTKTRSLKNVKKTPVNAIFLQAFQSVEQPKHEQTRIGKKIIRLARQVVQQKSTIH